MHLHAGVVTRVAELGQAIFWRAIREVFAEPDETTPRWHLVKEWGKETQIYRTIYCTVTGMTVDELKELNGL
jgi:hypothetical protein